jgi:hypothetical protein
MIVTPVDEHHNLFQVRNLVPDSLLAQINSTNWLDLSYNKIDKQEYMVRKNINGETLPWHEEWRKAVDSLFDVMWESNNVVLQRGQNTSWWIDEPGFDCPIHSDDTRVKVALQMYWIGAEDLGTRFYTDDTGTELRKKFDFVPNTGYLMINNAEQYHDMRMPIPPGTFRLTSYTWLYLHTSAFKV